MEAKLIKKTKETGDQRKKKDITRPQTGNIDNDLKARVDIQTIMCSDHHHTDPPQKLSNLLSTTTSGINKHSGLLIDVHELEEPRAISQWQSDGVNMKPIVCYQRGLIWGTDRGQTSFMEYTSVTSVKSALPFNHCLNSRRYTNQTGRRAALRLMNVGCFRNGVCVLFVFEFYRGCNSVYRGTKTAADPSSEETPLAHEV